MKREPIEYRDYWIAIVVEAERFQSRGQYWIAKGPDGTGLVLGQTRDPMAHATEDDAWYAAEAAAKAHIDGLIEGGSAST